MKILLISNCGEFKYGLLKYFQNALISLEHEVSWFSIKPTSHGLELSKTSLVNIYVNKIINRLQESIFNFKIEILKSRLKKIVEDFKPGLIITANGSNIDEEILQYLKQKGIPIFNFYPDPIPYNNFSFIKRIPSYTCIVTYSKDHVPSWYLLGAKKVLYLPFASDPSVHSPHSLSENEKTFYYSPLAYLATWQPYAALFPRKLVKFGLKIWGDQWYRLDKNSKLKQCWQGEGIGIGDEFSKVCSSASIIFNVVRPVNGQSHSMKTFEIPACGGFMLTNRTEEQINFFPEDIAAVYFSTEDELIDKVQFYLKNESIRKSILVKGYEIAQNHRYFHRMQTLIDFYKSNI